MASKGDRLAYIKSDEVRLVRRKHRIGFRIGTTAGEIIERLKKVPANASVDEVIDDIDGDEITTIEFHDESVSR